MQGRAACAAAAQLWWGRTYGDEKHLQVPGLLRPRSHFTAEEKNQISAGILAAAPGWRRVIGCGSDGQESQAAASGLPSEVCPSVRALKARPTEQVPWGTSTPQRGWDSSSVLP